MYEWTGWQDHVTEHENWYIETDNGDGTITHEAVEGEVLQQGTPQSAKNFNHMEDGISNAGELAAFMAIGAIHQRQQLQNLLGEVLIVSLTNNMEYPFNNSIKTVALLRPRNNLDYVVTAEVLEYSGGCVGDLEVTEKLANGFKIAHTGSAKSVKLKVFVKGGFY